MLLNEDQQSKKESVQNLAHEMKAEEERLNAELIWVTQALRSKLHAALREAVDAGVPKRQLQTALGITGTATFYQVLREANVPIEEKPKALSERRQIKGVW